MTYSIKQEVNDTFSIGGPLIASQLVYASSSFVGTAMVAKLGEDALAASILVSMIWATLSVVFFGMLNAICVLVSHQYGTKNRQAISQIMGQAHLLGIVLCVIIMLVLSSIPFFLHWSHQPASVVKLAEAYTEAWLWAVPALVALIISEQFLAGVNKTKIVLRISLLVVPIEIPLIYAFVFGKWGFPECGIAGVGYGFATTYTVTAFFLTYYLLESKSYKAYQLYVGMKKPDFTILKELIRVGLPMGFMNLIEVSTFAITTYIIAYYGTLYLAAHQIAMQYLSFAITLVFAMAQAVSIRVGHAVGRKDLMGIHYAAYVGMMLNFVGVLMFAIVFYAFPHFFLQLDVNVKDAHNTELVRHASLFLAIMGVLLLFDNFRIIGTGVLRGLKDTRFSMYSSFVCFWLVGLPSAFIFSFLFHWGAAGVWWGLTFGIAVGALIVYLRLRLLLQRLDEGALALIADVDLK